MHKQLLIKKILRYTRNLLILFFTSTLLTVIIYRFMPVYITPLMVIRSVQQIISGDKPTWKHTWVSFDKISPSLPMAVIASEDNRFAEHNGFDFVEIKKAMKENETRNGNVEQALSASRQQRMYSYGRNLHGCARPGSLLYVSHRTVLAERTDHGSLSQLYRNGKWHLRRASYRKVKFGTTAAQLTRGQCALIAATLPNPIRFNSAKPSSYILKRQKQILRLMNLVPKFPSEEKAVEKKKKQKQERSDN